MEILKKQISPESEAVVEISGGKIVLSAKLDTEGLDAQLGVSVSTEYFLDELAKKIPGTIDDAFLAVLKQALKAL